MSIGDPTARVESDVPASVVHRALHAEVERARRRRGDQPVRVLDVGGGSGAWAVPMAAAGCAVTVVDTSPNALAALQGRAREAGVGSRVVALQGDVLTLADVVPEADADLVLGHGLLEVVDDVDSTLANLAAATRPAGAVSVLVSGLYGAVIAQVHAGRVSQANAVLADPRGRTGQQDPLQRRLSLAAAREVLQATEGLSVELVQGDGVFEGWLPAAAWASDPDDLAELEAAMARTPELLVLAARLHLMARKSG
ncbi:MAG TPA: methyltransferase domain-containing protein [Pseudonocardia sp.]|jgi:SAM-dependent methyltransferase|nr:methyltransferase domain-containing protein [Pseudonocardia sp.]